MNNNNSGERIYRITIEPKYGAEKISLALNAGKLRYEVENFLRHDKHLVKTELFGWENIDAGEEPQAVLLNVNTDVISEAVVDSVVRVCVIPLKLVSSRCS